MSDSDDFDFGALAVNRQDETATRPQTRSTASQRGEDESIEDFIRRIHENAAERLLGLTPDALDTLEDLLTDDSVPPSVRHKAVTDVLDRVGLKQSIKVEVSGEVGVAPSETISERLAALAAGRAAVEAITVVQTEDEEIVDVDEVSEGE